MSIVPRISSPMQSSENLKGLGVQLGKRGLGDHTQVPGFNPQHQGKEKNHTIVCVCGGVHEKADIGMSLIDHHPPPLLFGDRVSR